MDLFHYFPARERHPCLHLRQSRPRGGEEELRSPVLLPHFPYAQQSGLQDPVTCPICLDKLRHGQLCSEVPACRHTFHEACIRAWAMKTNSCPLCRVKIVPAANDMV
jgi:hypothetical protein